MKLKDQLMEKAFCHPRGKARFWGNVMQQPQVYADIGLEGAYRLYCRIAAIGFVLITVYPVSVKLLEQRLAQDWLHSVLHLGSALLAAYAGWFAINILWAKGFTWAVGFLYLVLGVYGWFAAGLFLESRFAIPLGVADNLFHLILSVPALILAGFDHLVRPIKPRAGVVPHE
jgi:hypothetical protein